MTVDVSLSTDGHVPFRDVKEILEGAGCGPVEIVRVQEIEDPAAGIPRIGHFRFRDPSNRRRTREMRVHHFLGASEEDDTHITGRNRPTA